MTLLDRETIFQFSRDEGFQAVSSPDPDGVFRWGVRGGMIERMDLDSLCASLDGLGSREVNGVCSAPTGVAPGPSQYAPSVACPPGTLIGWVGIERPDGIVYQCRESASSNAPARITPGSSSLPCPPGMETVDIGGGLRYCRPPGTPAASSTAMPLRCPPGSTTMPSGQCYQDNRPGIYIAQSDPPVIVPPVGWGIPNPNLPPVTVVPPSSMQYEALLPSPTPLYADATGTVSHTPPVQPFYANTFDIASIDGPIRNLVPDWIEAPLDNLGISPVVVLAAVIGGLFLFSNSK